MIDEIEIIDPEGRESVFITTAKRCPPKAIATRAMMEVLDYYNPELQPDESLRQLNGELLPQAAALTALRVVKDLLGPFQPFVAQMEHDLREEWHR